MTANLPVVVFAAVDGVLYDRRRHSFDHAATLLDRLDQREAPIVLCSDKTHAELERVGHLLGINHPFIVERGAAVFVPHGYFSGDVADAHEVGGYLVIEPDGAEGERVDIGHAVEWLCARYRRAFGPLITVGVGCDTQHLPLLRSVDVPVIVQHSDTRVTARLQAALPDARLTVLDGSPAWATVVLDIVQRSAQIPATSPGECR